jgi:hypothetical protein
MWRKWPALLCLVAVAGFASSCETARPSAGKASTVSAYPSSLEEQFVHQTVFNLRDRYLAADVEGFMRLVSDGFYRGRARIQRSLTDTLAVRRPDEIDVVIQEIEIEEIKISASVTWTSVFSGRTGEETRRISGETLLIFQRGDGISLVDFRKDPLFGIEGF